jgi:agmatinase
LQASERRVGDDNQASCEKASECSRRADRNDFADNAVNTRVIFFPFDLFGGSGTKAGAELLAEAFEELLADNKRERIATRARAYANKIRFDEYTFVTLADYKDWRTTARARIRQVLGNDEFLVWITGNHLGAMPIYDELPRDTLVLQLDAHLDIYNLSDCTPEPTHGNFLLHAVQPLPRIVNVGHRELLLRPDYIQKYYHAAFSAADITRDEAGVLGKLREACASAENVFLDLDCDVLDPVFFPAVSQPRPFGLAPLFLLKVLDAVGAGKLRGLALSEFDPARDANDRCLETLMWLIEHVLLSKYER